MRKQKNIDKKKEQLFVANKTKFLEDQIVSVKLQLDSHQVLLESAQQMVNDVSIESSTAGAKKNAHLFYNLCKVYDEIDYFNFKLRQFQNKLRILQSGRPSRLPRTWKFKNKKSVYNTRSFNRSSKENSNSASLDTLDVFSDDSLSFKEGNQSSDEDYIMEEDEEYGRPHILRGGQHPCHQWVHNLRSYDDENEDFCNKFLVVLHGDSNKISSHTTFQALSKSACKDFKQHISKVVFIQRCNFTQLYILEELQKSLHFSLGSKSSEILHRFCVSCDVDTEKYTNADSHNAGSFYLKNQTPFEVDSTSPIQQCTDHMISLAQLFLPSLINTSNCSLSRANHVINLGITDQKIHQEKRLTITGSRGLSLISTWSKNCRVSNEAKTKLGDFIDVTPLNQEAATHMRDRFAPIHTAEIEYLQLFARQLNISDENDLSIFSIPACSILINDTLNPHCDLLNPSKKEHDVTLAISLQIPINNLHHSLKSILNQHYSGKIPFCLVLYKRNCLYTLVQHHIKIDEFLKCNSAAQYHNQRREEIVSMLSKSVYSEVDYAGLFFSSHRERLLEDKFYVHPKLLFNSKMAILKCAVDKCGKWSSLLHVIYMYCYIHGVRRDDVLSFILFCVEVLEASPAVVMEDV